METLRKKILIVREEDDTDLEIEADVVFIYYPATKGAREGGVPIEPDEECEVEILSVTTVDGVAVSLTSAEEAMVAEECAIYAASEDVW